MFLSWLKGVHPHPFFRLMRLDKSVETYLVLLPVLLAASLTTMPVAIGLVSLKDK